MISGLLTMSGGTSRFAPFHTSVLPIFCWRTHSWGQVRSAGALPPQVAVCCRCRGPAVGLDERVGVKVALVGVLWPAIFGKIVECGDLLVGVLSFKHLN